MSDSEAVEMLPGCPMNAVSGVLTHYDYRKVPVTTGVQGMQLHEYTVCEESVAQEKKQDTLSRGQTNNQSRGEVIMPPPLVYNLHEPT